MAFINALRDKFDIINVWDALKNKEWGKQDFKCKFIGNVECCTCLKYIDWLVTRWITPARIFTNVLNLKTTLLYTEYTFLFNTRKN